MTSDFKNRKKSANVLNHRMTYLDEGAGAPVIFLHGNPTSSYLWRNIIPHVSPIARCIAPDLIGMGDSDKLPDSSDTAYGFFEHRNYLDALFDQLVPDEPITLVLHDWGVVLGFDWARRHPDRLAGIIYMEGVVQPRKWDQLSDAMRDKIRELRGPSGDRMALEENFFVDNLLPAGILRTLTTEEMDEYRRPFAEPGEHRRPTLAWPRQIPIDGDPADTDEVVKAYAAWLPTAEVPKLFINAEPGNSITGALRDFCRTWPNQTEITVKGRHFIQEDSPEEIGIAIHDWLNAQYVNEIN